jgi:hypothetical protein
MSDPKKKKPYRKYAMTITPEIAQGWLDANNGKNYRCLGEDTARRYAALMKVGKWIEEHPDAIQFDWDGNLGNGQHRLKAVVIFDKPVRMFVEEGIDPSKFLGTDKNKGRSLADDAEFRGFRADSRSDRDRGVAIARRMLLGLRQGSLTLADHDNAIEIAKEYSDRILAVVDAMRNARPYRAEVAAAFCKAGFEYYTDEDGERLLAEARRYSDRLFTSKEDPLNRLYERLVTPHSGAKGQVEVYGSAISAIRGVMEGRSMRGLYVTEKDFLGPWEDGYMPPQRREKAKRASATVAGNMRSDMTKVEELYLQALEAGVVFEVANGVVTWKAPHRLPPFLSFRLNVVKDLLPQVMGAARTGA